MPTPDALAEVMAVLQDMLSGAPSHSPPRCPTWKHRDATEEHFRIQAEEAARREQDKHDRAKDRAAA